MSKIPPIQPITKRIQVPLQVLGVQSVKSSPHKGFRVGNDDMRPMEMLGLLLGVKRDRGMWLAALRSSGFKPGEAVRHFFFCSISSAYFSSVSSMAASTAFEIAEGNFGACCIYPLRYS
jgi:hypothetical protein